MLEELWIENFRSLKEFHIKFNPTITLIVGENDSGKTSLIDCLKVLFENSRVEADDFYYGTELINLRAKVDGKIYRIQINKENMIRKIEWLAEEVIVRQTLDDIRNGTIHEEPELKVTATEYGIVVRANSRQETISANLISKLEGLLETIVEGFVNIEIKSLPIQSTHFLDGKHFESISSFFTELFFKDKQKEIWDERINDESTIKEFISDTMITYSRSLITEIEQNGIKDKLIEYLPGLTGIGLKAEFEPKDLNINVSVQMLENGNEINVNKRGDGTKRRITMALLEYKSIIGGEAPILNVFDEPDTHLHVKAQKDFINTISKMVLNGTQIIVTTHSPFIINAFPPKNIQLLKMDTGETKICCLDNEVQIEKYLNELGIENIYLFFSKNILIVEGETEEAFIPLYYLHKYGKSISSNLVKVIKREGITDVPRFAHVLEKFVKPQDIYILIDNDADQLTNDIINRLQVPPENQILVGVKELEDGFKPDVLYNAWKEHVEEKGQRISTTWTIDEIAQARDECRANQEKMSARLKLLNAGCSEGMKKPLMGRVLANYCGLKLSPEEQVEGMPRELLSLLERIGG